MSSPKSQVIRGGGLLLTVEHFSRTCSPFCILTETSKVGLTGVARRKLIFLFLISWSIDISKAQSLIICRDHCRGWGLNNGRIFLLDLSQNIVKGLLGTWKATLAVIRMFVAQCVISLQKFPGRLCYNSNY